MNQGRLAAWATMVMVGLGLAFASPGATQPTVFDDMVPGSFLVFPLFDVAAGNSTQLRITNTGPDVRVQLNFVCPGSKKHPYCDALDRHKKLTPYETLVVDVADYNPPCNAGYVVAFAENSSREAIAFDHLIGSYHITSKGSLEAAPAISIQSVKGEGDNLGADGELQFGTAAGPDPDYRELPSHLYTDFRAVYPGTVGSDLILLTLDSIAGGHNPVTSVDIDFWNEHEDPFSTSWEFVCWTRVPLEQIDLNFLAGPFGYDYGHLKVRAEPKCPIAGGCPPLEPFDPTILGAINEFDSGTRTKRNLFHDREPKSTVFVPR
jgi:hypothetical protein